MVLIQSYCFISGSNVSLEDLNLSWNHIRLKGAVAIGNGIKVNKDIPVLWKTWLRHDTEILSALQLLCVGNPPFTGGLSSLRLVIRSLLNKQSRCHWCETLWRSCGQMDPFTENPDSKAHGANPTWGPPGSFRPQMGPVLAPWTLLSGKGMLVRLSTADWRHWMLSKGKAVYLIMTKSSQRDDMSAPISSDENSTIFLCKSIRRSDEKTVARPYWPWYGGSEGTCEKYIFLTRGPHSITGPLAYI